MFISKFVIKSEFVDKIRVINSKTNETINIDYHEKINNMYIFKFYIPYNIDLIIKWTFNSIEHENRIYIRESYTGNNVQYSYKYNYTIFETHMVDY